MLISSGYGRRRRVHGGAEPAAVVPAGDDWAERPGLGASMGIKEGRGLSGLWNVGRRRSVHGEHSSTAVEDVGGEEKHDAATGVPIYRHGMWRNHPK